MSSYRTYEAPTHDEYCQCIGCIAQAEHEQAIADQIAYLEGDE